MTERKIMTWEEIRQKYPSRWLVIEAFGAHSVYVTDVQYVVSLNGILGSDFLIQTGAIIDFGTRTIFKGA